MYEFGYTFKEIEEMTPAQINFLISFLNKKQRLEEAQLRRLRKR